MDVSIVIPAEAADLSAVTTALEGIARQQYDAGPIDVVVVQYGAGPPDMPPPFASHHTVRFLSTGHRSPYAARNLGVRETRGEALLFTEPGCVPDEGWVAAHVRALGRPGVTLSVGHVAPVRETSATRLFQSYETVRDAWVFGHGSWRHLFGRPKNMAVRRARFLSHGPFVEMMRGADSKLVQRVAREVSPAEIVHAADAVVRLVSARGLPTWFADRFAHARALRRHRSAHAAPIAFADRVRIFRETTRTQGYGLMASGMLLGLLAAGVIVFRAGGASARVGPSPPSTPSTP